MAGLLGIGQSALMAAYAQLQTTGHNIANANTPGYSRQEAVLATASGIHTGAGFLGSGVDVVTVQRRYDRFLTGELASSTAASASDTARSAHLERLQRVLADTDNGIGAAIDDLDMALADVVNRASDPTARQVVIQRAETLAQRIRNADLQMHALGSDADEQIAHAAERVNELLEQFAGLNDRIAAARAGGHPPNDLLDERDRVLMQLNGYLKATAHEQDDGTVNLFASAGEGLVVGSRAAELKVGADPSDASKQRIVLKNGAAELPMTAASFGGGSIAGWMRFRDDDLAHTRTELAKLAAEIADAYNTRQQLGVDAHGQAGAKLFEPGAVGADFRSLLVSGDQLAAAYRVTPQLAATNSGDAIVDSFAVIGAVSDDTVTIRFNGDGTFDMTGAAGDPVSVPYTPGVPIEYNGWSLMLRGSPKDGDIVQVVRNENFATDGRNARAMIARSEGLTDSFATIIGDLGARTQSAQASVTASSGLLENAKAAHAGHSAVNLDEEAARLLQYQQMYQAAARVIQAAQSMFDSLLAATAR